MEGCQDFIELGIGRWFEFVLTALRFVVAVDDRDYFPDRLFLGLSGGPLEPASDSEDF